jgi:AsmA family protein
MKRIVLGIFGALLLMFVAALIFVHFYDWNRLRPFIAEQSREQTGRALRIEGDLDVRVLSFQPSVTVQNFYYENANWSEAGPMFQAQSFHASVRLFPLIIGRINVADIRLEEARVLLEQSADGKANWDLPGVEPDDEEPAGDFNIPVVENLLLRDISFAYVDHQAEQNVEGTLRELRGGAENRNAPMIFSGNGQLQGHEFNLAGETGATSEVDSRDPFPVEMRFELVDFLQSSAKGSIDDPRTLEGVDLGLNLEAERIAELARSFGVELAVVPPLLFSGRLVGGDNRWELQDIQTTFGFTQVVGQAAANLEAKPHLNAELNFNRLHIDDFLQLLPETPEVERDYLIPEDPLPIEALHAFNAEVEVVISQITGEGIAPLLIRNSSMTMNITDGRFALSPMKVNTGGGTISMNAYLDAANEEPQARFELAMSGVELSKMVDKVEPQQQAEGLVESEMARVIEQLSGRLGGNIVIESQGKSPRELASHANGNIGFAIEEGTISHTLIELVGLDVVEAFGAWLRAEDAIRMKCMLASFPIENGRLKVDTFLLATKDSNVWGEGHVDLGSEQIDITMRVRPRDWGIGAIRAPLRVEGTFLEPQAAPKAEHLLARAGSALALGALVNPLAALIPFIEVAPGETGVCSEYIDEIREIGAKSDKKVEKDRERAPEL